MFRIRRAFVWPWLLLALLLQVDAVVKSTVMTAVMPMPVCGRAGTGMGMGDDGMAAMSAGAPQGSAHHRDDAHQAHCPYCSAAAHAPLTATGPLLRPSCTVSFAAYRVATATGPRGPPPTQPRARDPPRSA